MQMFLRHRRKATVQLTDGGDSGGVRDAAIAFAREGADATIDDAVEPCGRQTLALINTERRPRLALHGELHDKAFRPQLRDEAPRVPLAANNASFAGELYGAAGGSGQP